MIKKFFKAIILGLWESTILRGTLTCLLMISWFPLLTGVVLRLCNVNLSDVDAIGIGITSIFVGPFISVFVSHCLRALRYQEEKECSFHDAWNATDYCGDEY